MSHADWISVLSGLGGIAAGSVVVLTAQWLYYRKRK